MLLSKQVFQEHSLFSFYFHNRVNIQLEEAKTIFCWISLTLVDVSTKRSKEISLQLVPCHGRFDASAQWRALAKFNRKFTILGAEMILLFSKRLQPLFISIAGVWGALNVHCCYHILFSFPHIIMMIDESHVWYRQEQLKEQKF